MRKDVDCYSHLKHIFYAIRDVRMFYVVSCLLLHVYLRYMLIGGLLPSMEHNVGGAGILNFHLTL